MSEFQPDTALINKDLANRSHAFTSFDPEIRAKQEIDGFSAEVQAVYDEVSRYAKTEAQKAFLAEEMARFQAGYAAKYNAHLAAKGRCFSSMITGGSGFNNRAHDKANRSEDNRYEECRDFKQRAMSAMIREIKKLAVEEAGGEVEVMKQKISGAEKLQEDMKTANKIARSDIAKEDKLKQLETMGFSGRQAIEAITPDFCGRIGYTYHLQNNSANIRRMKERLAELQAKEAKPTSALTFPGGRVVDNAELDRVQIIHAEKPSQEVIDKLKAEGWHWSPAGRCWQRKRTDAAMMSAKRITGAV